MNVRYDIYPELVRANVARKVRELRRFRSTKMIEARDLNVRYASDLEAGLVHRMWIHAPTSPEVVSQIYIGMIKCELDRYSTVRIIRIGARKYILVYGDVNDDTVSSGTGPFKSLSAACEWFLNGGR